MAINLSAEDHLAMDGFLGSVLDAFAAGDVSRKEAVTVLAHIITEAAIGNEQVANLWRKPNH